MYIYICIYIYIRYKFLNAGYNHYMTQKIYLEINLSNLSFI